MLEREVKLGAGPGFHMPLLDGVAEGITSEPLKEVRLDTTYYDTPDLRLARWGFSLRHRAGEGWTLKVPAESKGVLLARQELSFPGSSKRPPAAALTLVRAMVRGVPLEPVAHLWTRRRLVRVTDAAGGRLADVVDDEVSVLDGRRVAARFRELEVEIDDSAGNGILDALVDLLRGAGAGAPDPVPKYVRALGPMAQQPPEVLQPELDAEATAAAVLRHALGQAVLALIRHDPGVRLGGDPEDVHQARVATRRMRSHLRTFKSLLEPEWTDALRSELGWLGGELGAVRDAEVLLARMTARVEDLVPEDRPAAGRLTARLAARVETSRQELIAAMNSDRYVQLLERLVEAAGAPRTLSLAEVPARAGLPALAGRAWRRLRKAVNSLADEPPDADLHQVRILAKRARYAAEAAAPVVGREAEALARAAARVQTVLGEHQDSVTAQDWLRSVPVRGRPAFVAGQLFTVERRAQARARAAWPAAWRSLDRKRLRNWIPPAKQQQPSPPPLHRGSNDHASNDP